MPDLCFTDATAESCAKANGWPAEPKIRSGPGSPEGSVIGYWPGDLWMNTSTSHMYGFNGTPGEDTGWLLLSDTH